jgi:ribosomal protein L11 methyltransferase
VLANILATPLKVLAPLLCSPCGARRRPGAGRHSGAPGEELQQAYAPYGWRLEVADTEDGWILMTAALKP